MTASKKSCAILLWGLLLMVTGCQQDDSRVARVAQEAAQRQAEQNKQMAQLQGQVAEGAKRLVEADAKARAEVAAMQRDVQQSQVEVGRQRDQLEAERRQFAQQRGRDPLIASAITATGLILACLLPLLLCIYLVRSLREPAETDVALAEILIEEMASPEMILLPPPQAADAVPQLPDGTHMP
jgi:hypothetical protein